MREGSKERQQIPLEYRWKLEDVYPDQDSWENDFRRVRELLLEIQAFQGRLGDSAGALWEVLQKSEELERTADKLFVYSRMRRDEDNANHRYQVSFDRIEALSVEAGSVTAFMVPEMLTIDEERLYRFMEEQPELALYRHYFEELLRQKEHILSAAEERILAMSADLSSATGNIFSMLNNADIRFPSITDEHGHEVELTKGRFGGFMESTDRRVRKDAFTSLYSTYSGLKNTLATTLTASVRKDIFYARVRKYPGALEAALDQDNISPRVYQSLIEAVHDKLDYLHRYMKLRKKLMNVDELHFYDLYVPLVQEHQKPFSYEEAREIVLQGLAPLGTEYLQVVKQGLENGWVDVFENQGKTGGAYSWGSYDTHPYILMNFDGKLNDVFTLAHELGHAMHSYYSNQNQPFVYSQYSIFVAEVASTVNESLLIEHLLRNSRERREKMYLLNHYLEQFRGTVYRQTMFAEFEKLVHERVEAGEPASVEDLSQIYKDLNARYFGAEVVLDDEIRVEWARIPHFYSAFYVYKYATGFSAATALKQMILTEGQPALERYMRFLKSGGSDYPMNILKEAGVDLTRGGPVEDALETFGRLLTKLEKLAD